jgi:hypothetical protein
LLQIFNATYLAKPLLIGITHVSKTFGENEMTELKGLILGVIFGLLVAFGIRALASWLTLFRARKRLSHYIETVRTNWP